MKAEPFNTSSPDTGICATVVTFYASLYPKLRQAAREQGYALALHGSLTRDLDVVAIPWVEDAKPPEALIEALTEAAGGYTCEGEAREKPHGRSTITIHLGRDGGYIDLSIMPLTKEPA